MKTAVHHEHGVGIVGAWVRRFLRPDSRPCSRWLFPAIAFFITPALVIAIWGLAFWLLEGIVFARASRVRQEECESAAPDVEDVVAARPVGGA